MKKGVFRDFFLGFVKIHILYHAAETGFYGVELAREMDRHGYSLGPGTLYPTLHRLEQDGYLKNSVRVENGRRRIYYNITPRGARLLRDAREKIKELVSEVVERTSDPARKAAS
jgi:DNA-binding PadR family transcriptional regulator